MPYDPERWHDFATSFAGAAGALLGLAFVAISFNLDAILRYKTLPGRAVDAIWHRHILNTKKYMADSDEYLGRYLHHNPHMRMEKETSEPSTAWLNTIRVYKATFGMEPTQSWLVGQADCDCND